MTIFLYEIAHYNPATNATETLRVSTFGFVDNATGLQYPKKIIQAGGFGVYAFSEGATFGNPALKDGQIVLSNLDREYDYLRNHDFRGVTIKSVERGQQLSDARLVANCEIEASELTWTELALTINNRLGALNVQAMTATFAGNNINAFGVEGGVALQGKLKPVLIGKVGWLEPLMVNTSSLLYVINHTKAGAPKAIAAINGVKDNGVSLALHQNYASINALVAAQMGGSIPAGKYGTCLAQGAFALGTYAVGTITCKATESTTSNTVAYITERFIANYTSFGSVAGVGELHSDYPFDAGYYLQGTETALQVVSTLMASVNGWVVPTLGGAGRMGRLRDPAIVPPVAIFGKNDIIKSSSGGLNNIPFSDETGGIPSHKVIVNYQKHYRILSPSELAGSVSVADVQELGLEYRSVALEDVSVLVAYRQSEPLTLNTAFSTKAAAEAFASDQLALRKVWRDLYVIEVQVKGTPYNVGDVVRLDIEAFDLKGGKNFQILGVVLDIAGEMATYYLYG